MNGLALYAGAGVGELSFRQILPDYRSIGYVDNEQYCQANLRARIRDGVLDDAPIFGDIREFNTRCASSYVGKVDWLSAGFPCQPFSVAGRQLGETDERNLWPATRDAISIIRPHYIFLENVPALLNGQRWFIKALEKVRQIDLFDAAHKKSIAGYIIRHIIKIIGPSYIGRIFGELAEIGYDCEWDVVSAAFVGAPHLRKRVWILAYSRHGAGWNVGTAQEGNHTEARRAIGASAAGRSSEQSKAVADAEKSGLERNVTTGPSRSNGCAPERSSNVADSEGSATRGLPGREKEEKPQPGIGGQVCNSNSNGCDQARGDFPETGCDGVIGTNWWSVEPNVGRVAYGVADRVDRLKALGNGWVPQVVERLLRRAG